MNIGRVTCALFRNLIPYTNVTGVEPLIFVTFTHYVNRRCIHSLIPNYAAHFKHRDRKDLLRTVTKPDEGLEDHLVSLNASIRTKEDMFTDDKTPHLLFNGVAFNKVPVCNVQIKKNNAKFRITDSDNNSIVYRSNGMEGFKKCRRGTNVAAQTTALTVGTKAITKGVKDVRLKIQGLGPGRLAAIKGLQLSGLNIISVTDDTRISWKPTARPRKVRRL